jgi:hypothetical protein
LESSGAKSTRSCASACITQRQSPYVSKRHQTLAYVSIQRAAAQTAHVSIREHT